MAAQEWLNIASCNVPAFVLPYDGYMPCAYHYHADITRENVREFERFIGSSPNNLGSPLKIYLTPLLLISHDQDR